MADGPKTDRRGALKTIAVTGGVVTVGALVTTHGVKVFVQDRGTGMDESTREIGSRSVQKLPSLAVSPIERILPHGGVILETVIRHIEH